MAIDDPAVLHLWQAFTRLGEAQILLPAALLTGFALLRQPDGRRMALAWVAWLTVAVLATTASKLAFIGWGLGWAALDFTGFSGHAMFAAAVYPLLLAVLLPRSERLGAAPGVLLGALLAVGVGLSRVAVSAHSTSEVVTALALGGAVSALALADAPRRRLHVPVWLPLLAAGWLVSTPALAPPSQTHAIVTRLALAISGRPQPYTRADMWREHLREPRSRSFSVNLGRS